VPVTDVALARRLERAEASASRAFMESRARLAPETGAAWREVAGAYAMFDGAGSPLTQTFGFALFAPADAADLDALEAFLAGRGAEASHEVSPLADPAHLALLASRGYRPIELTTVLWQPLDGRATPAPRPGAPIARRIDDDEIAAWAAASARGWAHAPELAAFMGDFGNVSARAEGTTCFVAELEGQVVATGAMAIHGGVALLAGASTIEAFRGRGAQGALLAARLTFAAAQGCDLAMMGAAPGSTSQTNAERQGFRVGYTRVKWGR